MQDNRKSIDFLFITVLYRTVISDRYLLYRTILYRTVIKVGL